MDEKYSRVTNHKKYRDNYSAIFKRKESTNEKDTKKKKNKTTY
jgi:hypothetical protein